MTAIVWRSSWIERSCSVAVCADSRSPAASSPWTRLSWVLRERSRLESWSFCELSSSGASVCSICSMCVWIWSRSGASCAEKSSAVVALVGSASIWSRSAPTCSACAWRSVASPPPSPPPPPPPQPAARRRTRAPARTAPSRVRRVSSVRRTVTLIPDKSSPTGGCARCRLAGVSSTLRFLSIARTLKACMPVPRPEYVFGDEQAVQAPLMCRHWNVEPGSLETNLNVALRLRVEPGGLAVIVVSGSTWSIAIRSDLLALRRPPVTTWLASPVFLSTPFRIAFFNCCGVIAGSFGRGAAPPRPLRGATPSTCRRTRRSPRRWLSGT